MKKLFYIAIILLFFIGCNFKSYQNSIDIQNVKYGMQYNEVQNIMRNKHERFFDNHIYQQSIPVNTYYYESPIGSSGDYEILCRKNDNTVVSIYYGN